jgi:hypothetical protein
VVGFRPLPEERTMKKKLAAATAAALFSVGDPDFYDKDETT